MCVVCVWRIVFKTYTRNCRVKSFIWCVTVWNFLVTKSIRNVVLRFLFCLWPKGFFEKRDRDEEKRKIWFGGSTDLYEGSEKTEFYDASTSAFYSVDVVSALSATCKTYVRGVCLVRRRLTALALHHPHISSSSHMCALAIWPEIVCVFEIQVRDVLLSSWK